MALTKTYRPRQEGLANLTEASLAPELVSAVRRSDDSSMRVPHPGILEFPLFSTTFSEALLRELHAFEHWCRHHQQSPTRPNSMNAYGAVLAELGLDDVMDELLHSWLLPLTTRHFPRHAGDQLDYQYGFLVDYSEAGDTSLGFHVDDSEVTLNACLGLTFQGAEVYFRGERCDEHRSGPVDSDERWQWDPKPGHAILHAGAHRHGVLPLRAGRRINLILWMKSSRHRQSPPTTRRSWCRVCEPK